MVVVRWSAYIYWRPSVICLAKDVFRESDDGRKDFLPIYRNRHVMKETLKDVISGDNNESILIYR